MKRAPLLADDQGTGGEFSAMRSLSSKRPAKTSAQVSPTANQHDTITAVELAPADYEQMFGHV
ncbi:hypothetical protein [Nocardia xishanensis]